MRTAPKRLPYLSQTSAAARPDPRCGDQHARKGPRHLAVLDLGAGRRRGARARLRAGRAGFQARRRTSRSSATTARGSTGRWPRRSAWAACRCPLYQDAVAAGDGLRPRRRRRRASRSSRTRSRSTSCSRSRTRLPEARAHRLRRPARHAPLRASRFCTRYDERAGARPRASTRASRISSMPRSSRASGDDVAIMLYTSGTTGKPKGVCSDPCGADRRGARRLRVRPARAARRDPVLPADGLGRRQPVLLRAGAGRRLHASTARSPARR